MKRSIKRLCLFMLVFSMVLGMALSAQAAVKLSKKKLSIPAGTSYQLVLNGTSKKVSWQSSNKSVATVKKGLVKAKKPGVARITAKAGKKKYTCTVKVGKKQNIYVGVDMSNFAVTYIDGGRVQVKVQQVKQVGNNRMDISFLFCPLDSDVVIRKIALGMFDNNGKSFFNETIVFDAAPYIPQGNVHRHTVRLYKKEFRTMRFINLNKLKEDRFTYYVNLDI